MRYDVDLISKNFSLFMQGHISQRDQLYYCRVKWLSATERCSGRAYRQRQHQFSRSGVHVQKQPYLHKPLPSKHHPSVSHSLTHTHTLTHPPSLLTPSTPPPLPSPPPPTTPVVGSHSASLAKTLTWSQTLSYESPTLDSSPLSM